MFFLELIIHFFCLLSFLSTYYLFRPKLSLTYKSLNTFKHHIFYQLHLLEAIFLRPFWLVLMWTGFALGCCVAIVLYLHPMVLVTLLTLCFIVFLVSQSLLSFLAYDLMTLPLNENPSVIFCENVYEVKFWWSHIPENIFILTTQVMGSLVRSRILLCKSFPLRTL
jgi:hypothetical protein